MPCEDAIVARADVARARPDFRHVVLEACVVCLGHMTGRSNQALICSRRCASTLRRARLRDRALADSGAGAHDGVSPLSTVPCRLCGFDSPGRFSSTGAPASKICTPCERAIVERAAAARAHPNYGLVALEACAVCLGVIGPHKRSVTCSNRCASTLALVTTRDRLRGSHDRAAGGDAAAAAALFGDVASTSDDLGVEEGADAGISGIDDALDALDALLEVVPSGVPADVLSELSRVNELQALPVPSVGNEPSGLAAGPASTSLPVPAASFRGGSPAGVGHPELHAAEQAVVSAHDALAAARAALDSARHGVMSDESLVERARMSAEAYLLAPDDDLFDDDILGLEAQLDEDESVGVSPVPPDPGPPECEAQAVALVSDDCAELDADFRANIAVMRIACAIDGTRLLPDGTVVDAFADLVAEHALPLYLERVTAAETRLVRACAAYFARASALADVPADERADALAAGVDAAPAALLYLERVTSAETRLVRACAAYFAGASALADVPPDERADALAPGVDAAPGALLGGGAAPRAVGVDEPSDVGATIGPRRVAVFAPELVYPGCDGRTEFSRHWELGPFSDADGHWRIGGEAQFPDAMRAAFLAVPLCAALVARFGATRVPVVLAEALLVAYGFPHGAQPLAALDWYRAARSELAAFGDVHVRGFPLVESERAPPVDASTRCWRCHAPSQVAPGRKPPRVSLCLDCRGFLLLVCDACVKVRGDVAARTRVWCLVCSESRHLTTPPSRTAPSQHCAHLVCSDRCWRLYLRVRERAFEIGAQWPLPVAAPLVGAALARVGAPHCEGDDGRVDDVGALALRPPMMSRQCPISLPTPARRGRRSRHEEDGFQ